MLKYFINYSVGKTLRIPPTNILAWMLAATKQRIQGKFVEECQEFVYKSVTKTLAAAVVPRSNLDNVILYFRS